MECTISSESQKQGGSRNGSGTVVHATQREKKAELVPVVFQTVGRNFGCRREGVKLEQRRKMKHILAISEFGFVLYFNIHNTPKFKHATPHANRLASTPRNCANIAELCQADAHVTLLLRTLKFAL